MYQTFLSRPKISKTFIYAKPESDYQKFVNAYCYHKIAMTSDFSLEKKKLVDEANNEWKLIKHNKDIIPNKIFEYFTTPVQLSGNIVPISTNNSLSSSSSSSFSSSSSSSSSSLPSPTIIPITSDLVKPNAAAQKKVIETLNYSKNARASLEAEFNSITNMVVRSSIESEINALNRNIESDEKQLNKLKRSAMYQQRSRDKKLKSIYEKNEYVQYNCPGRPPFLFKYPQLLDHIHECIEFGEADNRRRKEVIKIRTTTHLKSALEERYFEYLSRTCLRNHLLPKNKSTIAARAHHHPAMVAVAGVSRDLRRSHVDEHYCLASVKAAKLLARSFASHSVIISQDDKAKVPVGIPAVSRTFETMQTINEPVRVEDHDFPIGTSQKLIPSVYLMINPNESDEMRSGQLSIFVRSQWDLGTSTLTHLTDLKTLASLPEFSHFFNINDQLKSIWILLVDGGPDENPRHEKNIHRYCKFFHLMNLDYLTIRTHAPHQSSYNPVERSMSTLSKKLVGITLSINTFGNHLDSSGKVINKELGRRNFQHAGMKLCELWQKDKINEKSVYCTYIDEKTNPFADVVFPFRENEISIKLKGKCNEDDYPHVPWSWIENHTKLCEYSLDI